MKKKKPFYGWAITTMGTLGNAFQGGLIFWSMGMYTSTFEDQFGASRARITLIETFLSVGTNVLSPLIGMYVDKRSARHVMTAGIASLGLGLVVLSQAGSLLSVWATFALLIPFGAVSIGVLPSATLISRWFRRRRGLALGINVTGTSIGGAIAPPLLAWMFIVYGWRTSLFVIGLAVLAVAPVFWKVIADHPEDMGLEQEEEGDDSDYNLTAADSHDWRIRELFRTKAFWLQTLITACMLGVTLGLLANLSLHAKDLGFSGPQIGALYSTIALLSGIGKIGFGWVIDRIGVRKAGLISVALMIVGLGLLATADTYVLVFAAASVIGCATGGVAPTWVNLIARGFGARSVGRAMGVMNPLHIPITAPSAPLAGYISDTTGSYTLVFLIFIGMMVVAGVCLAVVGKPVPRASS
jgi:sugar phosphate permease